MSSKQPKVKTLPLSREQLLDALTFHLQSLGVLGRGDLKVVDIEGLPLGKLKIKVVKEDPIPF